jgi:tRNA-intron endonuclease
VPEEFEAELHGDHVLVPNAREASQIYNRGWFGTPQSGGAIKLELVEALHLLENGRLRVTEDGKPVDLAGLLRHAIDVQDGFEIRYMVYSDLKERGYTVRPFTTNSKSAGRLGVEDRAAADSEPDFAAYERGALPSRSQTRFYILARSERAQFELDGLRRFTERAESFNKKVLMAIVDEEGDLTYYELSSVQPCGQLAHGSGPECASAVVLEERVLVFDNDMARKLQAAHYGRPAGKALQLSLLEAAYLEEKGALELTNARTGKPVTRAALLKKARRQLDFDIRLRVYRDLREKGLVVRTGFKYGTHFRMYDADPASSHAKYLLHAVPEKFTSTWPEMSRAVRLAHGVRKELLLARVGKGDVIYIKLGRMRP